MVGEIIRRELAKASGKRAFLFYGTEDFLWEEAITQLRDALLPPDLQSLNFAVVDGRAASRSAVAETVRTMPFLADWRLVVVRDAPYFGTEKKNNGETAVAKSKTDAVAELLPECSSTCLIFTAGEVDQRRAAFKTISKYGQAFAFNPLQGKDLAEWARKRIAAGGKTVRPEALQLLLENTGSNLRLLDQEIGKLLLYLGERKALAREDVAALVSRLPENDIFAMVDCLGARQKKAALKRLGEMLQLGEPPVRLLFMLVRQVRLILEGKLLAERGYTRSQIAVALGVQPFVAQKAVEQGKNFTLDELKRLLDRLLQTDAAVKRGLWEPRLALELLLCQI